MSLLTKQAQVKNDTSGILSLAKEAQQAKAFNPLVVDATIGMLYDEEGKLLCFDSVKSKLNELSDVDKFAYSTTAGSEEFHEAVLNWVFRDFKEDMLHKMYCNVIATPGGSGAICTAFCNYLNPEDEVLLPSVMWGNYKQIAYEAYANFTTYELFDELGNFNLKDLMSKCAMLKRKQGRVVLVVNDPCHNPTGYCMKYEEWIGLVTFINEISRDGTPFILIYDMAYIDYDARGFQVSRDNLRLFQIFNENVLAILAFSGSKTLGLYGLRIGASIALSHNKENVEDFARACEYSARAKWSTSTNLGMNLIANLLNDPLSNQQFCNELNQAKQLVAERAKAFIEGCKKVNLKTLPFECGFFATIKCDNADAVFEKLKRRDVYVVPMKDYIRVALSAISIEQAGMLPGLIKEAL